MLNRPKIEKKQEYLRQFTESKLTSQLNLELDIYRIQTTATALVVPE